MRRPFWITLIAAIVLAGGIYLASIALVLLIFPRTISVLRHFPLSSLKLAVPYFTFSVGVLWCCIAWGLLQLKNWARVTASVLLGLGVFWDLTKLLGHHVHSNWSEIGIILEIVLRSAAAIYLQSSAIAYVFEEKPQ